MKSKEVKVEKRKMGLDKHEEIKLVQDVKEEVGSRGDVRHIENSDQLFSEKKWWADE